jgi:hypothetical protein
MHTALFSFASPRSAYLTLPRLTQAAVTKRRQALSSPLDRDKKIAKVGWKAELCSQCYIRKDNAIEIVYIQHPDGTSVNNLHGGRQSSGKTMNCPLFQKKLTAPEQRSWATALRTMKNQGLLLDLYRKHVHPKE